MPVSQEGDRKREAHTARLSFRSTPTLYAKLVKIAEKHGWIGANGSPNVTRVLNFLIEQFDLGQKKGGANGRRKR